MFEKLKGKYVFFDIDGTLSEFRYNNKLFSDNDYGCQSLKDLLFGDLFYKARPLKTMQEIISMLDSDKVFVLGTVFTNNEARQKYKWLAENFPNIKEGNIIFINRAEIKPLVILEYAKYFKLNISEIVFVDDRLDVLREAEKLGIECYHPSSFVD